MEKTGHRYFEGVTHQISIPSLTNKMSCSGDNGEERLVVLQFLHKYSNQ